MKNSSPHCILCAVPGVADLWNDLRVLRCPACGLAWRATFDLPSDFYKTVEVDVETGKKEARKRNTQNQIKTLKKFLPPSGIYDLGSGDGTFLSELRDSGYLNCVGIEPGENGLRVSVERNLNVFRGTIQDLPQISKGKKVHAVTMFHLLEHLDDPKKSLEIIRKSLDSQGILVLETPDIDAPLQRLTNHKNHLVYPEHLFYWNKMSLCKLLTQVGFSVISIKHRSFNWQQAPIRRSLLRLGLITNKKNGKKPVIAEEVQNHLVKSSRTYEDGFMRSLVRKLLAYLVHMLRRDDYILVVARPRHV